MDSKGFDFTSSMRNVARDMVHRLDEFSHIDLPRVAFCFSQARNRSLYGLHATLTPMRFRGGRLMTRRGGQEYTVQRLVDCDGTEMLYILSFYLPRFMDVDLNEKLITIFHELWHISPDFDGDIRRHPGRCYAHSRSQRKYDAKMQEFAARWLDARPPQRLYEFMRLDFGQLQRQYGPVYGNRLRQPKLIQIDASLPVHSAAANHLA